MDKAHGGGVVLVQAAQGRVHRHGQPGGHGVFDAGHSVVKALRPHQCIVDGGVVAVQRYLHAVETGLIQPAAQLRRQQPPVGVQPGDEPLGGLHQLHQIGAERGLAAGERHLRDIGGAKLRQYLLPLGGGQLRRVGQGLTGGVAVQALLVAVPRAATGHGADHEIHAVGRGHLRGVLSQRQRGDLRLRLLPAGDGHQRPDHGGQITRQPLLGREGIGLARLGHSAGGHGAPVALGDLQPGEGLQPIHKVGQQDRPAEVQGHQTAAVEQQKKGRVVRVLTGRDHVDAQHAATLGIQRDMAHALQMAAAIAPLQQCSHRQFLLLKAIYGQYTTTGGIRQETRKKEPTRAKKNLHMQKKPPAFTRGFFYPWDAVPGAQCAFLNTVSGAEMTTRVLSATEPVRNALPPTTECSPMTVSPPRMDAPE